MITRHIRQPLRPALLACVLACLMAMIAVGAAPVPTSIAPTTPAVDGTLLSRETCAETPNEGDYGAYRQRQVATFRAEAAGARKLNLAIRSEQQALQAFMSEEAYTARHRRDAVVCERLVYASDGLRVVAYLWRPREFGTQPLPLIIFNRGGAGEESKLRPNTQFGFDRFVQAGYVVLGSQYRGNDGGEGREELGGADVNDVFALAALARSLPFVDTTRSFMLGYSRGGMMTLLAARAGLPLSAAATVGAPTNFIALLSSPDPRTLDGFKALVPNFAADPRAALRQRSALMWAEELQVPLLVLHGGADPLVPAGVHALPFVARLHELGKSFEFVLYDRDTHGLMLSAEDRDARILAWFARFGGAPLNPQPPDTPP